MIRRYANPLYHARKICEDVHAACHAVKCRGLDGDSFEDVAKAMRGRLFAAFFVAGGCGFTGPFASAALQFATKNYWVGVISAIVVTHGVATCAFQAAWWFSSRCLYAGLPTGKERFLALERDILPVQIRGLKWMLTMSVVSIPVKLGIAWVLSTFWPQAVTFLPISAVVMGFDIIFVDSTFVRVMGDIFERHSKVLVLRHQALFKCLQEGRGCPETHADGRGPTPELASVPTH